MVCFFSGVLKIPENNSIFYYEEYTANLSFSGACFSVAQLVAIKINRVGKLITFTMTSLTVAASGFTSSNYNTGAGVFRRVYVRHIH